MRYGVKEYMSYLWDGPRPDWDTYFLLHAEIASLRSTCISRNTGSVIVRDNKIISTGYNGWPAGERNCIEHFSLPDNPCERLREGIKTGDGYNEDFCRADHSEVNAVRNANGSTNYATLYLFTKSLKPGGRHYEYGLCKGCTGTVLRAGIVRAVVESVVLEESGDFGSERSEVETTFKKILKESRKRLEFDSEKLRKNYYKMGGTEKL